VLRRKVDELEARMGFALLLRRANGVTLTEEGRKVYQAALEMEKASFDLLKAQGDTALEAGEVTVAVSEGLGSFWLTSKLPEFQQACPGVSLNLFSLPQLEDITRLEPDIQIRLERPKSSELRISKLGRLHLMYYASRSYLDMYGTPSGIETLSKHRLIYQYDAQKRWIMPERHFFPGGAPRPNLRINVGSANGWSIFQGAGIGILPTYVETLVDNLVALDLGQPFPLDIWITYHADAKKIPRVSKTIEWLTRAFDPRRHPWFRDAFVHPRDFGKKNRSSGWPA
jgi:DNA-binding transcriptional LysR family regulator